jgi:transcriptional regulator with XRE-family HTH domain
MTIHRIETGETARGGTLRKLAEALGISPDELFPA